MKEGLVKIVKEFLFAHVTEDKPILVGLSGGGDSRALLSLLLECRLFYSLDLQVAHFDHAWRKESEEEATQLKKEVESLGLFFHTQRSNAAYFLNKEERAREERYLFFHEVYHKVGAQAIFLAHQREDQAETVLKRIFEGAGISSLQGMQERSLYQGMVLLRPLLSVTKKELLAWNKKKSIDYFEDYTNQDLSFLRPRIREKLMPELERWFGKSIQKNLCHLAEEFSLLREHLEERLMPLLGTRKVGALGFFFPLSTLQLNSSFERRELIRLSFKKAGIETKRESLKIMESLLLSGVCDKLIKMGGCEVLMNKGDFFCFQEPLKEFEGEFSMEEGFLNQDFEMQINAGKLDFFDLTALFLEGKMIYVLPQDQKNLRLTSYEALGTKDQKKISFLLSKNRIPARMRRLFPFLTKDGRLLEECLLFNFDSMRFVDNYLLTIKLKK